MIPHLRRLFFYNLPPLRHAARIFRRTRNRINGLHPFQVASGAPASTSQPSLIRGLGLLDSVLLLVGGIIGSSHFSHCQRHCRPPASPCAFSAGLGARRHDFHVRLLRLRRTGSMFPEAGGQYVYLREAYGDLPAFLYGWMLFSVANGGSIAALCRGFGRLPRRHHPRHFAAARSAVPSPALC